MSVQAALVITEAVHCDFGPTIVWTSRSGHSGRDPRVCWALRVSVDRGVRSPHWCHLLLRQPFTLRSKRLSWSWTEKSQGPAGLTMCPWSYRWLVICLGWRGLDHVVLTVPGDAGRGAAGGRVQGRGQAEVRGGLAGEGAGVVSWGHWVRGEVFVHLVKSWGRLLRSREEVGGVMLLHAVSWPRSVKGRGQGEGASGDPHRLHELSLELLDLVTDETQPPHVHLCHGVGLEDAILERRVPLETVTKRGQFWVFLDTFQFLVSLKLGYFQFSLLTSHRKNGGKCKASGQFPRSLIWTFICTRPEKNNNSNLDTFCKNSNSYLLGFDWSGLTSNSDNFWNFVSTRLSSVWSPRIVVSYSENIISHLNLIIPHHIWTWCWD